MDKYHFINVLIVNLIKLNKKDVLFIKSKDFYHIHILYDYKIGFQINKLMEKSIKNLFCLKLAKIDKM